jgi:hypothetical protein
VTVDGVVVEELQFLRGRASGGSGCSDASLLGHAVTLLLHKPAGHEALLLPTHQFAGDRSDLHIESTCRRPSWSIRR